jgi:hypothetical protein
MVSIQMNKNHERMASWRDEVEESVHSVVPEARVTFDSGFFGKNIIILAFEIANNFLESIKTIKREGSFGFRTRTRTRYQCCRQIQGCQQ